MRIEYKLNYLTEDVIIQIKDIKLLVEVKGVRQIPDEGIRRWFMDKDMDLIIWYESENDSLIGFQISYDKRSVQRTVTWKSADQGKTSSSLTCDGPYNKNRLLKLLESKTEQMDSELVQFLMSQLQRK